jgi:hypothetical protein
MGNRKSLCRDVSGGFAAQSILFPLRTLPLPGKVLCSIEVGDRPPHSFWVRYRVLQGGDQDLVE